MPNKIGGNFNRNGGISGFYMGKDIKDCIKKSPKDIDSKLGIGVLQTCASWISQLDE